MEEKSKRRGGWSGEMFEWENMEEGEEEECVEGRKGQRGGTVGVGKCLNGRTWKKVKRRSGWSGEWENGWSGGMVKGEEYVGTEGTSTHMMTSFTHPNSELLSGCSLFYRNFRVEHRDNKAILMSSMKWRRRSTTAVSRISIIS